MATSYRAEDQHGFRAPERMIARAVLRTTVGSVAGPHRADPKQLNERPNSPAFAAEPNSITDAELTTNAIPLGSAHDGGPANGCGLQ